MQALTVQSHNTLGYPTLPLPLYLAHYNESATTSSLENQPGPIWFSRTWVIQLAIISVLSTLLLFRYLSATWALATPSPPLKCKDPPQVLYFLPVVGNSISYLLDAAQLASSITCVLPFPPYSLLLQAFKIGIDRRLGKNMGLQLSFVLIF